MSKSGLRPDGRCFGANTSVSVIALAAAIWMAPIQIAAQVSIDGSTSTNVVVNSDGSVTVGIAPATSDGVSINRYNQFNVPEPGMELDNRVEGARTIVNEVTSTNITTIEGPVEVLGQRAHTIIANPNGIVVDGGRFINTGRVALTTGQISTSTFQIAPNIFQENVVSTVEDGKITISGGGLSGQMDAVDLLAHSIQVDGPITNDNSNPDASIRLVAGSTETEFNSAIIPGNAALTWASVTGAGATSEDSILIEITAPGVMRANKLGIEVSDLGAGVRFAGEGYATSRSFTLTADGEISVEEAKIEGNEGVFISGGSIDMADSLVTAPNGSMQIDTSGAFKANGTTANAFAHMLVTADEVALSTGANPMELKAENGGFILTTLGENSDGDLINRGGLLQGGVDIDSLRNSATTRSDGAVTLDIAGDIVNASDGDETAIIFGAGGGVSIVNQGGVENNRGRILANGSVSIRSEGDVLNWVEAPNGSLDPEIVEYVRDGDPIWWTLFIKSERESYVSYDYGILENPDQLATITASGDVSIWTPSGEVINQGGEINANDGDLQIVASRLETIGVGSGHVYVRKNCVFTCDYEGDGEVIYYGGRLNASQDIRINTPEEFYNNAGSVFAVGDVEIRTENATLEAALVPTLVERPEGLYNFWASKAAWIFLRDQFGSIVADTGKVRVISKNPLTIIGGTYSAGDSVHLRNGEEIVRAPDVYSNALENTIGLFADFPLIEQ